jgi:hypothetical protein
MNLDTSSLVNPGHLRGDQGLSRKPRPQDQPAEHPKNPRLLSVVAMLWRTLRRDLTDPYRPELHYMRGPGPKWRAKHGVSQPGEARDFADRAAIAA